MAAGPLPEPLPGSREALAALLAGVGASHRLELRRSFDVQTGLRWGWRGRRIDDCLLVLVLAGEGRYRALGREVPLRPGTALLLWGGFPYDALRVPPQGPRVVNARFERLRCADGRADRAGIGDCLLPVVLPDLRSAVEVLRCGRSSPCPGLRSAALHLVLAWIAAAAQRSPARSQDRHLHALAERLRADPSRRPDLRAEAKAAGLSPAWFSDRFKELHGEAPRDFRLRLLFEQARVRLEDGDESVGEVARSLGYASRSAFSREFRRRCGLAPAACRRPACGGS